MVRKDQACKPERVTRQKHKRQKRWTSEVAQAPTYYPTWEEFQDPMQYISSIEAEASQFGICKIIPPVTATTPPALVINRSRPKPFMFDTRQQWIHRQDWKTFSSEQFYDGSLYTLAEYEAMANRFQQQLFGVAGTLPAAMIEEAYWREVEACHGLSVEYGNDVDGTAFSAPTSQDPLASTPWNLQVLPTLQNSTLRLVSQAIPGVSTPMLYVGMLFSAFAWHVEDQYLYSINYQHLGAAKTWYGVPSTGADAFEDLVQAEVYMKAAKAAARKGCTEQEIKDATLKTLIRKTTMFSPELLVEAGVPVCRAVQAPGEFIVTFPRAYHAGFSNGFCVGEAANFSTGSWFKYGAQACARYCRLKHPIMLSHEYLLCTEAESLTAMPVEARTGHVTYPAAKEFIQTMKRYSDETQMLVGMDAHIQETREPSPPRHACDLCSYPCFIARVALEHNSLSCCFPCALGQPRRFLQGARILHHPKYSAFCQMASQLQSEEAVATPAQPVIRCMPEGIETAGLCSDNVKVRWTNPDSSYSCFTTICAATATQQAC